MSAVGGGRRKEAERLKRMAAPPQEYLSVLTELQTFSIANAANREEAIEMVADFMDDIRPRIDDVLRDYRDVLSDAQKRAFDEAEEAIHHQIAAQFPEPGPAPAGNGGNGGINQGVTIYVYGSVVDHTKFARELVPAISKAIKDGVR